MRNATLARMDGSAHTGYMTNTCDNIPAVAYADAKARLNLFEASLFHNPYNATPGATGVRDLDRAYERIVGWQEAKLFVRL